MEQTTVSSRIPEPLNASLEEAANARGAFRSEIIRRALRYYIEQNPDAIQSFDDTSRNSLPTVSQPHEIKGG